MPRECGCMQLSIVYIRLDSVWRGASIGSGAICCLSRPSGGGRCRIRELLR